VYNVIMSIPTPPGLKLPPSTICELVTTDSRGLAIEVALREFQVAEFQVYGSNVKVDIVSLDCGGNFLNAYLRAFNLETFDMYDVRVRAEYAAGQGYSKVREQLSIHYHMPSEHLKEPMAVLHLPRPATSCCPSTSQSPLHRPSRQSPKLLPQHPQCPLHLILAAQLCSNNNT
jgi:hypothetical protein